MLTTGPADAAHHVLLAHGAGAAMTSAFLDQFASAIGRHGVTVHRFEFAYMAARRTHGAPRRPPPPVETLMPEFVACAVALHHELGRPFTIGGKSMGGRIATMIADDLHNRGIANACICLGYPFHPVGRPDKLRTSHLERLRCPTLVVQGERDPFGTRDEVATYALPTSIDLAWLAAADHDFRPARGSGTTRADVIATSAAAAARFLKHVDQN